MSRSLLLGLALLIGTVSLAANITVVVNGKSIKIPVTTVAGKTYIDLAALAKALGGMATLSKDKLVIVGQSPNADTGIQAAVQLAGDNGVLAKPFKLRARNPLVFTLLSAEFTTDQVNIGDTLIAPKADEKLLLLRFTVQNPQKDDLFVRWDSLRFTVVDAMDVNHRCTDQWGDAKTKLPVALSLKPAQKIEAYTVIRVPGKGTIPKLMVEPQSDNDGPILRYDLRDKITPLAAPIADPADNTTALETVPAQVGAAYPFNRFDITVEKFSYTTEALDAGGPEKNGRFLVATLLVKNATTRPTFLRFDGVDPVLISTDGEKLRYRSMLLATANRPISQNIDADQEMRIRLYFNVPRDCTPKTLTLKEGTSRSYVFEVKE